MPRNLVATPHLAVVALLAAPALLLGACAHDAQVAPAAAARAEAPQPPVAAKRPHRIAVDDRVRTDEYYWLRDDERQDPAVIEYLRAENAYADAVLAPTRSLQEQIFVELKSRLKEDDSTVPWRLGDWWYYARYESGAEHPIHARRRGSPQGPEQVLLDTNRMARGHEFFKVADLAVSHDGNRLSWAEDTVGREEWVIHVKDLTSGEILPDELRNVSGQSVWANDGQTLFYVRQQEGTLIPYQVWRHRLGIPTSEDQLVYEESDSTFYVGIDKSRDHARIIIGSFSTLTSEYRILDAARPEKAPEVLIPRQRGHEYYAEVLGDVAWLRTNRDAKNFRLVKVPVDEAADEGAWRDVVPGSDSVLLNDFLVFDDHLVVEERQAATLGLRVMDLDGGSSRPVGSGDGAWTAYLDANPNASADVLRYAYTSMVEPRTVVGFDMGSGASTVLQVKEVPGYDASKYETRRIHATARDGERIPVTLLARKGTRPDGTAPLLAYGYGAYGAAMDPAFDQRRASLVDRGFVWAIIHVRGGDEYGRRWYESGKLLNKRNTFNDFIDATEHLVENGWAAPDKVVAMGRSAGGLLMGAVANLRPDLYRAIVAGVPFVDVVTTMLDESIPLTTFEFDEWGNPKEPEFYDYMLGYSPYDQVAAQDYPAIYVSGGLWDPRVQYWEPAKWVARLRDRRTDHDPILLVTEMEAGHFASPGRYENLKDTAREYAFVLAQLGLVPTTTARGSAAP
jgi:oligopeptidase B